jgi:hypothetical protein
MHDMKFVLFVMPLNLTAFARSVTPRRRGAHQHHKASRTKSCPKEKL